MKKTYTLFLFASAFWIGFLNQANAQSPSIKNDSKPTAAMLAEEEVKQSKLTQNNPSSNKNQSESAGISLEGTSNKSVQPLERSFLSETIVRFGEEALLTSKAGFVAEIVVKNLNKEKCLDAGLVAARQGFSALEINILTGNIKASGSPVTLSELGLKLWAEQNLTN